MQLFLDMRARSYRGFASIEKNKGLLQPEVSLNTPHGQEMLRMLMFRTIEECVESINSRDRDHELEEVIDAYNYLWAMLIIDPVRFKPLELATMLHKTFIDPSSTTNMTWSGHPGGALDTRDVGEIAEWLAGDVGEVLRNRAWMQNAQDNYFAGIDVLRIAICRVTYRLYRVFPSWTSFAAMYIAKDAVLQFRLRSNY
jgi:hypothetical protein